MSSFKEPTRREFLAVASSAALAAAAGAASAEAATSESLPTATPYTEADLLKPAPQRSFSGEYATQVAMPLGGIGAGSVCLNGYGGLQDFSIRTRPETTALPSTFSASSPEAAFAVLHIKGGVTKLIEGPFPAFKIFDQGLQGQGLRRGGFEGFPRFQKCVFQGEYPFGHASFSDKSIPLAISLTAWSPFIPRDDKNSGIPCVLLEYTLHNASSREVAYEFSYHLSHLALGCKPEQASTVNTVIPGKGVFLSNTEEPNSESYGSATLTAIGHQPRIKGMWLRSPGWEFDSLSALWGEVSTGTFTPNEGSNSIDTSGRNGASILLEGTLAPGKSIVYPILITWHFPNSYIHDGGKTAPQGIQGNVGCRTMGAGQPPLWRPYYVRHWKDAREVAQYVESDYASLRERTVKFKDALFASTLPPYVLDAISSNLAILKSPTVLREENGNLWGWEGCFPDSGCCHGSCTHVWNYAQAFPHLYPQLERTLRDLELVRSMDERGHVTFRGAIPDGPVDHSWHAASDGQLGGLMKLYRDWQISGDLDWLKQMYPLAKRSLEYGISTWDPDRHGALFEPHHNTYDIEFWGPEPMCSSIYLGSLSAMAQMATATGHPDDASQCSDLAHRCAAFLDEQLFNGEYYQQKVQYLDLHDTSFAATVAHVDDKSSEMQQLLKREGPKYQYGSGCLSDGVIGAWMARTYGIETPLARNNVRSTLRAIFNHNFKTDLSDHANAQRPGYAMGKEPGLLLCSWPRGDKPTLPFVYSDEVWTGIEYQVASHLIQEGFVTEGLTIVKALRSRYDGKTRNPWNEYECGNYYARAMSSYSLLGALSGFRYSAVEKTLWFGPRLSIRPFRSFFSAASAFGTIELHPDALHVQVIEGELPIGHLVLPDHDNEQTLEWKTTIRQGTTAKRSLSN
jgi:uncharacterized protein (DUF608 family)